VITGVTYLIATVAPFVFPAWRGMDRSRARSAGLIASP
jgi:hypothetical protein